MKILNVYSSRSGNTQKVAMQIKKTIEQQKFEIDTIKIEKNFNINQLNLLSYDLIFIGSGVYNWLPPQEMIDFIEKNHAKHATNGDIKMCSPLLNNKNIVAYSTFGGPHTGINEGNIAPKYMSQLFEHLGFKILDEWHIAAAFHGSYSKYSIGGKMGDLADKPNNNDLLQIAQKVKTILDSLT